MNIRKNLWLALIVAYVVSFSSMSNAKAIESIATDSRIKTYVYGENEVFIIRAKYLYQSSIELAKNEEISAISLGDSVGWQITPVGRVIFIRPTQENIHTNMTVITNKRIYQFELYSYDNNDNNDLITYVVRFYYPQHDMDRPVQIKSTSEISRAATGGEGGYNFAYTLTGPDSIAPIKIFDDGKHTYFQFPNNNSVIPDIQLVSNDSSSISRLGYRIVGRFVVINAVMERDEKLTLRHGREVVTVYNEGLKK